MLFMLLKPVRRLIVMAIVAAALFALCTSIVSARQTQANPADAIVGDWRPADMHAEVRIFPANGQYLGGIVKADNQEMVNKEMMRSITFDPATNTWKGEVFAFKMGQFVPMSIKMTPTGFEMVAGSGFMSKTVEWVRVR